ncbi:hypothetical protein Q3G72_028094 [Acer saccharum]|nr:hypothetical protein Q3G72_028094 [Acer saccharum]
MATTSKLNNNLLLLSSKRTQNLRMSLCRFKSLKFGANSNFSNSTSSAPIINNAAVSFYSDSSQQPKFSIKRAASDEVKSSGSTNKNNLFDAVKNNALNLLKSKVKVAAALMMLGMMMINGHKRKPAFALAFPDAIKVLDWHSNNSLFSYSSVSEILYCVAKGNILWENDGKKFFSKLLYKEQTKFDKERPAYLRNENTEGITSHIQADEFKNTYTVFSMVMANVEIVNMSRCYSLNMFKEFIPMGVFSRQVNVRAMIL